MICRQKGHVRVLPVRLWEEIFRTTSLSLWPFKLDNALPCRAASTLSPLLKGPGPKMCLGRGLGASPSMEGGAASGPGTEGIEPRLDRLLAPSDRTVRSRSERHAGGKPACLLQPIDLGHRQSGDLNEVSLPVYPIVIRHARSPLKESVHAQAKGTEASANFKGGRRPWAQYL